MQYGDNWAKHLPCWDEHLQSHRLRRLQPHRLQHKVMASYARLCRFRLGVGQYRPRRQATERVKPDFFISTETPCKVAKRVANGLWN